MYFRISSTLKVWKCRWVTWIRLSLDHTVTIPTRPSHFIATLLHQSQGWDNGAFWPSCGFILYFWREGAVYLSNLFSVYYFQDCSYKSLQHIPDEEESDTSGLFSLKTLFFTAVSISTQTLLNVPRVTRLALRYFITFHYMNWTITILILINI